METQSTDWVDAVRYFRGLGPARRRRSEHVVFAACLVILAVVTLLAVLQQLS